MLHGCFGLHPRLGALFEAQSHGLELLGNSVFKLGVCVQGVNTPHAVAANGRNKMSMRPRRQLNGSKNVPPHPLARRQVVLLRARAAIYIMHGEGAQDASAGQAALAFVERQVPSRPDLHGCIRKALSQIYVSVRQRKVDGRPRCAIAAGFQENCQDRGHLNPS